MLIPERFRRFTKEPKLVFRGELCFVSGIGSAIEGAPEHLPGGNGKRVAVFVQEVHEEQCGSGLPGYSPERAAIDSRLRVGIASVPSGVPAVVVEDIAD